MFLAIINSILLGGLTSVAYAANRGLLGKNSRRAGK